MNNPDFCVWLKGMHYAYSKLINLFKYFDRIDVSHLCYLIIHCRHVSDISKLYITGLLCS